MSEAKYSIDGKSVLVTGGSGSFGRAFILNALRNHQPKRLVLFSRDEMKQAEVASMISEQALDPDCRMRFFIGDVRDRDRLELAMRDIDVVIHAAAMKIVPVAEYNPFECVLTNIHGAENVVKAALNQCVERVIALSTDKAVNPINLYGASKLAADKIMVAANNLSGNLGTRFAVVRYGNVIGSRGSIVPVFQRRIARKEKTLPITDPRMTRFWITLQQGVDFVLSCLDLASGGEVFVPKIPSMRITDLAKTMAPDLEHEIIGIRPGEKLHEVMITEDDARLTMELPDRFVILPIPADDRAVVVDRVRTRLMALGGKPVADGFRYASDLNDDWLDEAGMRALLERAG